MTNSRRWRNMFFLGENWEQIANSYTNGRIQKRNAEVCSMFRDRVR
jgi:hypothetical protein